MTRSRHLTVRTVLAVIALSTLAGVAPASPAVAAPAEEETGRMQLVLDSSGSMSEPAAGGQSKIQAAKAALNTVVDGLPEEAQVGLRVYGATVFSRSDPGACTDSQEVVAPGTDNRDELRDAIASYKPYGETPIAHALREAGKDLGSEGHRTIVLVSDGEATCPPSPCVVARQLAQDGIDLRIDVVGLDVSGQAREQLACIADAGRGQYYDADDADDLVRALDRLSTRALRPFQVTGERVDGGDTEASAAPVSAGQYIDTLGGGVGTEKWYLVERQIPGSSLHVGVAGKTSASTDEVELSTFAAGLAGAVECGSETWYDARTGGDTLFGIARVVDPRGFSSTDPACTDDDVLVLVRRGEEGASVPVDIELLVTEEPPVANTNALPPGLTDNAWVDPAPTGPATRVLGGTSFADAQPIEPGNYTGDIVPGETQVFALDVDWGEQPVFDVVFPRRRGALADAVGAYDIEVRTRLFTPVRGQFDYSAFLGGPDPSVAMDQENAERIGAAGPEIRYLNRDSPASSTASASVPGTYYLTVEASPDSEGESYVLPYTMRVDLPAGTDSGEPDYEGTDATTPEPATASKSAEPDPDEDSEKAAQASDDDGLGSVRLVAGVAAAGLGVVALGFAAFLLLARRRGP